LDKNKLEFILFKFFVNLVQLLGRKKSMKVAEVLALFFYYFIPIRKKVVHKNLSIAFPNKSKEEINNLAKQNYIHILKTFFDTFLLPSLTKEDIFSFTKFEGAEKLKEEYSRGKGVVLLTGHFGNWELGAIAIGLIMEQSINVLSKQQRNPYVSKWMDDTREKFGNKVSNLGSGVRELFKTLKSGGMIGIVGDQRGPKEGLRVKIFNHNTAVYSGFASIIAKSKSPVVIALAPRLEDDSYKIDFIKMEYPEEAENIIEKITQSYFDILQSYIEKYPEQWFWMHNIWKY